MCSKACGQVVSRARACGSRGVTSRITSRGFPRQDAVASSLSILPYFVTLLPRRSRRRSVCVVAMTTIASGKVVRTQKYQTSLVSFLRRRVRRGDARFEIGGLAPFAKGYGDIYETRVRQNDYFSLPCSFLPFPVSTVLIGSKTFFISTRMERSQDITMS